LRTRTTAIHSADRTISTPTIREGSTSRRVWQTADTDGNGVVARVFNAAGRALTAEIALNSTIAGAQSDLSLAMSPLGSFVAAWESAGADGTGIVARQFNADGTPAGGQFAVNTSTAGDQTDPTVGVDAQGRFVVAFTSGGNILAGRFAADGTALGAEFTVNSTTAGMQEFSSIAMTRDGQFVIAWQGPDADGMGIFARQYAADGSASGGQIAVNSFTTGRQYDPTVQVNADGNFIIGWTSMGQDGDREGVYAQWYNAAGSAQSNEFRLNDVTDGHQRDLSLGLRDEGELVATWVSDTAAPVVTDARTVRFGEQADSVAGRHLIEDVSQLIVTFSEPMSTVGADQGLTSVTNRWNWRLEKNGVWNPDAITSVTYGLDAESYQYEALLTFITPLDDGDFTLTARDTIFDAAGGALDGDVNGAAGGDWTTTFTIFPTRQVNTTTNDSQESPSVVLGADGRYVVVWESYEQDGSSWGIYAQRYNPDGTAAGDEFQVNTHTGDKQRNPSVAMAADGRFVVTWQSHAQDGSSWGIYAQRYNADGTTAGDEFRVNATTEDQQRSPEVAMAANGDFVVTWASLDAAGSESNWGVYGQRYNWDAAVGGQIQIFEEYGEGASWQRHENHRSEENYPSIATTSNGAFVVVWQDTDGGGNWPRIRAKRFDASGTDLGWFDVEPTHNAAHEPTVAMVDDGRFVVTWRGGDEIYARTFNADGSAATSTVQVNQTTEGSQSAPSVLMYPDGQFLVAWQGAGSEDSEGIFARRYHADSTP